MGRRPSFLFVRLRWDARAAPSRSSPAPRLWHHRVMEITWLGETCVRLRGREGIVVADAIAPWWVRPVEA